MGNYHYIYNAKIAFYGAAVSYGPGCRDRKPCVHVSVCCLYTRPLATSKPPPPCSLLISHLPAWPWCDCVCVCVCVQWMAYSIFTFTCNSKCTIWFSGTRECGCIGMRGGRSLCGWLRCFTHWLRWLSDGLRLCWKFSSTLDCVRASKLTRVFFILSAGRYWDWKLVVLSVVCWIVLLLFAAASAAAIRRECAKHSTVSVVSWAIFPSHMFDMSSGILCAIFVGADVVSFQ